MADLMSIKGISEIVFNVDDLPAMREFYQRVLGFEVLSEGCFDREDGESSDGPPTISFLTVAEQATPLGQHGHPQVLALIDHRRHTFSRSRLERIDQRCSPLNHIAFEIDPDAYDQWKAKLAEEELETIEARFRSFQAKAIFFRDIEGNRVELICHERKSMLEAH